MRISFTSLKVSIAGAKLSHLVQKDRIWDHGSMVEQARIIFCLAQKARNSKNIDMLKKSCSMICFEQLKIEASAQKKQLIAEPIINEIAIVEVYPGKNTRSDKFTALIKGESKDDAHEKFKSECVFVRQGDWWMLDKIK
jgi:hypothetical protein